MPDRSGPRRWTTCRYAARPHGPDWLGQQVAARPQDANLLAVYAAERGHLAKLAGSMVSGKLAEQRSLLSEKAVEQLELALTGIIRDPGHDRSEAYVRRVVARRLRSVGVTTPPQETATIDAQIGANVREPESVTF